MALPPSDITSFFARGDTLVASTDTVVWTSVNGGGNWLSSTRVGPTIDALNAVWFRNGRLWVGTYGDGVFSSDNRGATWTPRSQGLSGGIANSHLYITDFESRGDSLHAGTDGAGVFRLDLRLANPTWSKFGVQFEANTAGSVGAIERSGTRLIAGAGANGLVFTHPGGPVDWTPTPIAGAIAPGLTLSGIAVTPTSVIACGSGNCYRSANGEAPWTSIPPSVGATLECKLAARGSQVFAAFNKLGGVIFSVTLDHGTTWVPFDTLFEFCYALAVRGDMLWAARTDGLWTMSVATVSVPGVGVPGAGPAVALSVAGAQPARGTIALRLEAQVAARAVVRVLDARGREVARPLDGPWAGGSGTIVWDPVDVPPGVYFACADVGGSRAVARVVRLP